MFEVVLVRHGQSVWNKENLFTGWKDVELSEKGIEEAIHAGELLKEHGYQFDEAYTSVLKRAIKTCWLALESSDQMFIPVTRAWQLNERHYGGLTGKNKKETAEKYGEEQLLKWRRSYSTLPPLLEEDNPYYQEMSDHYARVGIKNVPKAESLATTVDRLVPFWENDIAPKIKAGKKILIAAHGNSLRALIKHIANISEEDIIKLEIPTGSPLVYKLDEKLNAVESFYLKDL
jgi:2,3-bisphosphoglycerate-dependent phosphoglycerate mutase